MKDLIVNLVCCVMIEVLCGVLIPEGKMKKLVLSVVSMFTFFGIVSPLCEWIVGAV